LIFLLVATVLPNRMWVGEYGAFLGKANFVFFGYISYLIPFYLGWILYSFYKGMQRVVFERMFIFLIGLVDVLIIQSIFLQKGLFGNLFVEATKPIIGVVGISLLVLMMFVLIYILLRPKVIGDIENRNEEVEDKVLEYAKSDKIKDEIAMKSELSADSEDNENKKEQNGKIDVNAYITQKLKELSAVVDEEIKEGVERVEKIDIDEDIGSRDEKVEEIEEVENSSKEVEKIDEDIGSRDEDIEVVENSSEEVEKIDIDEDIGSRDEEVEEIEEVENSSEEVEKIDEDIGSRDEKAENEVIEERKSQDEIVEDKIALEDVETKSIIVRELDENKELLQEIERGDVEKPANFVLPSLDFLSNPIKEDIQINEEEIDAKVQLLLNKLRNFKIDGDVVRTYTGPVVTTFEFKPLPHIKVSKILNLADDLAMALRAETIRIQAPIPGKDVVGIEIPNTKIETIYLREILEDEIFKNAKSPLVIALGKDIVGKPFVTDLAKLPHLLIAGTTGSGKSVGINAMILSLLYRNSPDDLKLMMIDPKMLEFSIYNDIPHLLTPVITDPKQAIAGLNQMVKEMERRYKLMSSARVKNIVNYNEKNPNSKMPYIVVIIDELADLMMSGGKDVEWSIARLAQMARASGIHLIVATQRPSVDVVTGLIKANLPSRISFKVGQKIDSKVVLDQYGAETLLGRGDMLFTPPSSSALVRLHAPFTTEEEIEKIVEFLKSQRIADYDENFLGENSESVELSDKDELFDEAKEIILKEQKTSISYLQRRLQIGYNRAANIIEQLEMSGFLSAPNSKGQREIL